MSEQLCLQRSIYQCISSLIPLFCKIHSFPLVFTSERPTFNFFSSWHNLSLLSYFSYFPFSVPIPPSFTCDHTNMLLVAQQFWKTSSIPPLCALPSVSLSRTPSPGSGLVPAETQTISGDIQNCSIIQVMSRASKQRFHTEGGFPVCRRSPSSEDGVEHL